MNNFAYSLGCLTGFGLTKQATLSPAQNKALNGVLKKQGIFGLGEDDEEDEDEGKKKSSDWWKWLLGAAAAGGLGYGGYKLYNWWNTPKAAPQSPPTGGPPTGGPLTGAATEAAPAYPPAGAVPPAAQVPATTPMGGVSAPTGAEAKASKLPAAALTAVPPPQSPTELPTKPLSQLTAQDV